MITTKNILVDIYVANCNSLGAKVAEEFQDDAMPTSEVMKVIWWGQNINVNNRLNKRVFGNLKGRALKKAERIVNINGSRSTSGEYGSLYVREQDFIPLEKK